MFVSTVCPVCGNSNPMTFHFHYARHPFRKSQYDRKNGQMICLGCNYESEIFPAIEYEKEKIKMEQIRCAEKANSIFDEVNVTVTPLSEVLPKHNFIVEVSGNKIHAFLNHLKEGGFCDVRVQM